MKYEIEYQDINTCPFCNGEAKLFTNDLLTRVICSSCHAHGPEVPVRCGVTEPDFISGAKAEAKAIALWNMIKGAGD